MPKFEVDAEMVRNLANLLTETGLTEIEYAEGEKRLRLMRGSVAVSGPTLPVAAMPVPHLATTAPATAPANESQPQGGVTSPMVGTAYLAPEPGAAPFIKVGDRIEAGATLLIIEAMKVMNPIKAPRSGTISRIIVTDAKPVEFGETLVVIE